MQWAYILIAFAIALLMADHLQQALVLLRES